MKSNMYTKAFSINSKEYCYLKSLTPDKDGNYLVQLDTLVEALQCFAKPLYVECKTGCIYSINNETLVNLPNNKTGKIIFSISTKDVLIDELLLDCLLGHVDFADESDHSTDLVVLMLSNGAKLFTPEKHKSQLLRVWKENHIYKNSIIEYNQKYYKVKDLIDL